MPYTILNNLAIQMLRKLIDRSYHHLLQVPARVDNRHSAAYVWQQVQNHFKGTHHGVKKELREKFQTVHSPLQILRSATTLQLDIAGECVVQGCMISFVDLYNT
jgi:hypothetical protein